MFDEWAPGAGQSVQRRQACPQPSTSATPTSASTTSASPTSASSITTDAPTTAPTTVASPPPSSTATTVQPSSTPDPSGACAFSFQEFLNMESQQEFSLPNISWSLSRVFEQGVWENTTTMSWNRWRPVIFPQDAHMPYDMLVMLDGPANSTSAPNISDFDPSWPVEFKYGDFWFTTGDGDISDPNAKPGCAVGNWTAFEVHRERHMVCLFNCNGIILGGDRPPKASWDSAEQGLNKSVALRRLEDRILT